MTIPTYIFNFWLKNLSTDDLAVMFVQNKNFLPWASDGDLAWLENKTLPCSALKQINVIVLGNDLAVLMANDSAALLLPSPVHVLTGSSRCFFRPSPRPSTALAGKSKADLLLFWEKNYITVEFSNLHLHCGLHEPAVLVSKRLVFVSSAENLLLGLKLMTEAVNPPIPQTPLQRHL